MNSVFSVLKQRIVGLATSPIHKTLPTLTILALMLNFLLESLGRHSIIEAILYLANVPLLFLCSSLIVFFTLSLCLLTRRRLSFLLVMTAFWITLGITNWIVLSYREAPLSAIDFLIAKDALGMFGLYLSVIQTVLIVLALSGFILLLVILFIKCPKCRVNYKKSLSCVLSIGIAVCISFLFTTSTAASVRESGVLSEAYSNYGFAYCFTRSLISQGVDRPSDYENDYVDELIDSLEPESEELTDHKLTPNVIFVQLESFIDVSNIKGLSCSKDPTPNFTMLKANGVSGMLRVFNVGGGTANTEFEVLTGMNLDHFGFGEYPYTTVLKSRACESLAYNLRSIGYAAHAIHNHTATFYERNTVYSNLGFDTFTPIELMREITRNPLGWAHDSILTKEIVSALDSTDSKDFVFAVSVQGHGKYPEEALSEQVPIHTDDNTSPQDEIDVYLSDESLYSQYKYYVNQLHEMDRFIGELIDEMSHREEPTVIVFYGDHMPSLPLNDEDLVNSDLFKTEYAVWSNFKLPASESLDSVNELDSDLEAYQLSAYIQTLLDLELGSITRLHQAKFESEDDRNEALNILEYASLYDDSQNEYIPTNMKFGTCHPRIHSYSQIGNTLYVQGDGFNEYSKVQIDGFVRNTQYVDSHTLAIENVYFAIDELKVLQIAEDGTEIYCTE